jgi:hypothetical protein
MYATQQKTSIQKNNDPTKNNNMGAIGLGLCFEGQNYQYFRTLVFFQNVTVPYETAPARMTNSLVVVTDITIEEEEIARE